MAERCEDKEANLDFSEQVYVGWLEPAFATRATRVSTNLFLDRQLSG
jgi:hypothetical protein